MSNNIEETSKPKRTRRKHINIIIRSEKRTNQFDKERNNRLIDDFIQILTERGSELSEVINRIIYPPVPPSVSFNVLTQEEIKEQQESHENFQNLYEQKQLVHNFICIYHAVNGTPPPEVLIKEYIRSITTTNNLLKNL